MYEGWGSIKRNAIYTNCTLSPLEKKRKHDDNLVRLNFTHWTFKTTYVDDSLHLNNMATAIGFINLDHDLEYDVKFLL